MPVSFCRGWCCLSYRKIISIIEREGFGHQGGLADDASVRTKSHAIPHRCQASVSRFEGILIDVNVSMWFEVLVEEACLSRSTGWKGLVYLVHYRDPGQTYGKPTNRTISFMFVGMIGLFVGVTSGTGKRVRRQHIVEHSSPDHVRSSIFASSATASNPLKGRNTGAVVLPLLITITLSSKYQIGWRDISPEILLGCVKRQSSIDGKLAVRVIVVSGSSSGVSDVKAVL
jgi:hypothetical protein